MHHDTARRRFLQATAVTGAALLFAQPAHTAALAELNGEVLVNGRRAMRDTVIRAGDTVRTGGDAMARFVIGADAFLLRGMSEVVFEAQRDSLLINGLRLVTGGLLAVFGPGMKSIMTQFVTAAIRGTGIYVEAGAGRTYFCTCYGRVGLTAGDGTTREVTADKHTAYFVGAGEGGRFSAAPFVNHDNRELAALERLAGRTPRLQ